MNRKGRQCIARSPVRRFSMQSHILTYSRLRKREPLIVLTSHHGGKGVEGGGWWWLYSASVVSHPPGEKGSRRSKHEIKCRIMSESELYLSLFINHPTPTPHPTLSNSISDSHSGVLRTQKLPGPASFCLPGSFYFIFSQTSPNKDCEMYGTVKRL